MSNAKLKNQNSIRKKNKDNFIKGVAMLAIAGIIVKVLGAFFRIPLANIIGSYGMAVYQPAYSVYAVFLAFATIGLPVALSKLTIEGSGAIRTSFRMLAAITLPSAVIVFVFADNISSFIGLEESAITLRAVAPAMIFLSVTASFRGYFQGQEKMLPTSSTQVIEQFARVLLGLFFAIAFYRGGISLGEYSDEAFGALGATIGTSISAMIGAAIMTFFYVRDRNKDKTLVEALVENGETKVTVNLELADKIGMKKLLKVTIAVTLSSAIFQIFTLVETPIIVNGLKSIGVSEIHAMSLYGQISGMIYPILNLPYVLLASIAMGIVPNLAKKNEMEQISTRDDSKTVLQTQIDTLVSKGINMGALIGFPAAAGIVLMGNDLLYLLYSSRENEITISNEVIVLLGFSVALLALIQPIMAIFQGLNMLKEGVMCAICGILTKCIFLYILTRTEIVGISGSPLSTLLGLMVILALALIILKTKTEIGIKAICWSDLKIPAFGSLLILVVGHISEWVISKFKYIAIFSEVEEQSRVSFYDYRNYLEETGTIEIVGIIVIAIVVYGIVMLCNKEKVKHMIKS